MKRRYQAIIILIVMFASLVLVLRGSVPERNATQIDGTSYLQSIDGNTPGPEIWSDNLTSQTSWQVYADNGTEGHLAFTNDSLNLTAFFPVSSQAQAVSIYRRPINVSLNDNPIAVATVRASNGIHYGMRFSGLEPGNFSFEAWYESSPNQHVLGHGINQNLTANLALDSYVANGQLPPQNSAITAIKFYIEATPGQTGWFSLILTRIAILPTLQKPYVDNGTYNGLIVPLGSNFEEANSLNESLFQAYVGFRIGGTSDLQYRLYFNKGLVTKAEGYIYHLKSILDYEEATLLPQQVHDFPLVYSDSNQSYISVVALQGSITYFKLDTLSFEFLPQTITASAYFDPSFAQFLFAYYIVFLFATPIVMVILFGRAFRNETDTTEQETTSRP